MPSLVETIMSNYTDANARIEQLSKKSISVIPWSELRKNYMPLEHRIVDDHLHREDKKNGEHIDEAARLSLGFEKLLVSRMSSFLFSIPVKRVYSHDNSDKAKAAVDAIEKIYKYARVNSMNIERSRCLYASCEFYTLWYTVEEPNDKYGFKSNFKIRCRTFSPMDGTELYPLFDEYGDLVAMSIGYKKKIEDDEIYFFETWTKDKHYKWRTKEGKYELEKQDNIEIIGKIPGVYAYRREPLCTKDISQLREDVEYKLSEDSDTISYNSSPVLKVSGEVTGAEKKGESRRIIRTSEGGDVGYVSWQQSIEATKYHVDKTIELMFMLTQMPDISASKMMELGNVGFDARQMIFADAHLKCGEESGLWTEVLSREFNVIKAVLKQMNTEWSDILETIDCEHVITPFIQKDLKSTVETLMAANGGKPIMSHKTSVQRLGITDNADEELSEINKDIEAAAELEKNKNPLASMLSAE